MNLALVKFAADKNSEPKYYLLDDKKYDDWVIGEPQEGYYIFETIGCWEVSDILLRDGIDTVSLMKNSDNKDSVAWVKGDNLGGIINFSYKEV